MRVVNTAVRSRVPVKFIWPPVCCCHGATIALKLSSSEPPQTPRTSTVLPAGSGANGGEVAVGDPEGGGLPVGEAMGEGLFEGKVVGDSLADGNGEIVGEAEAVGERTGDTVAVAVSAGVVAVGEVTGGVVVGSVVVGTVVVGVLGQEAASISIKIIPSIKRSLPKVSEAFFMFIPPDQT